MQLRHPAVRAFLVGGIGIGLGIGLAACTQPMPSDSSFKLTSDAFVDGGRIPARYTCDGDGVSPPLAWSDAPEGTAAFALLVTDPDAGGFVHWVLADIPGNVTLLHEGHGDSEGTAGRNSGGGNGWTGPCPPSGEHRYELTLFALSDATGLPAGASADDLRAAVRDRTLAEVRVRSTYSRGRPGAP